MKIMAICNSSRIIVVAVEEYFNPGRQHTTRLSSLDLDWSTGQILRQ